METITREDWLEEGTKLFGGTEFRKWRFKCTQCGEVQTMEDFVAAGVDPEEAAKRVYQECVGRTVDGRGCDWALWGFLKIHKREVVDTRDGVVVPVFEFAGLDDGS